MHTSIIYNVFLYTVNIVEVCVQLCSLFWRFLWDISLLLFKPSTEVKASLCRFVRCTYSIALKILYLILVRLSWFCCYCHVWYKETISLCSWSHHLCKRSCCHYWTKATHQWIHTSHPPSNILEATLCTFILEGEV